MNILLVDDDDDLRQAVGDFLEGQGHHVVAVPDGLKALLYLDEETDILISDIQMPGISGIDLLRTVRERFPDMPVILITAHASVETAVAALRHRAYDYLEKPLQLRELARIMERLSSRRS